MPAIYKGKEAFFASLGPALMDVINIYGMMKSIEMSEADLALKQRSAKIAGRQMDVLEGQFKIQQLDSALNILELAAGEEGIDAERMNNLVTFAKDTSNMDISSFFQASEYDKATGKPTKFKVETPDSRKAKLSALTAETNRLFKELSAQNMMIMQSLKLKTPLATWPGEEGTMALMPSGEVGVLPGGMRKPTIPAAEIGKISEEETSLQSLQNYKALYKSEYVGPINARIGYVKEKTGKIDVAQAEFYAEEAHLKNQMIKLITGAQMFEVEAKRILGEVPTRYDTDPVWEAKWKATQRNREMLLTKWKENLAKAGYKMPEVDTTKKIENMSIDELKAIIGD